MIVDAKQQERRIERKEENTNYSPAAMVLEEQRNRRIVLFCQMLIDLEEEQHGARQLATGSENWAMHYCFLLGPENENWAESLDWN